MKCNDDSGGDREVGMILSRRTDRGALGIFKLVSNNCPEAEVGLIKRRSDPLIYRVGHPIANVLKTTGAIRYVAAQI